VKLAIRRIRARLHEPFVSGHGCLRERELLLVSLEDRDGRVGYGEAAPLESYDGALIDEVTAALETLRPLLAGAELTSQAADSHEHLLGACAAIAVNNGAHIIRTHDVKETVDTVRIAERLRPTLFFRE